MATEAHVPLQLVRGLDRRATVLMPYLTFKLSVTWDAPCWLHTEILTTFIYLVQTAAKSLAPTLAVQ